MSTNGVVWRRRLSALFIVVFVAVVYVIFATRHGVGVWNEILRVGWPIFVLDFVGGVIEGVVQSRWRSSLWSYLAMLGSFVIFILSEYLLMQWMTVQDTWFVVLPLVPMIVGDMGIGIILTRRKTKVDFAL